MPQLKNYANKQINDTNKKIKNLNKKMDEITKIVRKNVKGYEGPYKPKFHRATGLVLKDILESDGQAFAAGLLDPNHNDQILNSMGIPDNASRNHAMFRSVYQASFRPDANGCIYLYMLPFAECPLMSYDTATGVFEAIPDPKFGWSYFKDNKVYAFRCVGQGVTAYNTSSATDNGGMCTAARFPAIIDNHAMQEASDTANIYGTCYTRCLEGLPTTQSDLSAAASHPYLANAAFGCYMVNRNTQPDFPFVYRNSDWEKSSSTIYKYNENGGIVTTGDNNLNVLSVLPANAEAQELPHLVAMDPSREVSLIGNSVPVTGLIGTGFQVGCIFFTQMPPNSCVNVKVCHGYELLLKPTSPLLVQIIPPLLPMPWIFEAIARDQKKRNYQALRADANFWGALWNGFKKVAQAVKPLTNELVQFVPAKFQSLAQSALDSVDNLTNDNKALTPVASAPSISNPVSITNRRGGRFRY